MNLQDVQNSLVAHTQEVDTLFEESESMILIEDVRLNDALKSQLVLQLKWERMTKKLNYLYDVCETEVEGAFAAAFKHELKNTYVDITQAQAREYAKTNQDYQEWRSMLNEVRNVRDEARGILDTVTSRKYILNNITNAVVASVNNHIL